MKKLLITTNNHGLTVETDTGVAVTEDVYLKRMADTKEWDPVDWYYYTRVNMKFSVKKGQKIQLRLDPQSMLKKYEFATYERPPGYKLPHWTEETISIDDARDIKANFTGIKAVDCFNNLKVRRPILQFEYNGSDATEDSSGDLQNMHYFAYDLFLQAPSTGQELWIGPVIRNDGGLGGNP